MLTTSLGLRIPEVLKEKIATLASINGRSLNHEIVARLSASTEGVQKLFEAFEVPGKAIRIRTTGNTTYDLDRLKLFLGNMDIERITVGAKHDHLNGAVLVFVAYVAGCAFIMDQTQLNMARSSRMPEIQDLFKSIERLGLLPRTFYFIDYVADTSALEVRDAFDSLKMTSTEKLDDLEIFLRLLSVHGLFQVADYRLP